MEERNPERIYGWLDSQLSIARHYGGCRFNGADYVIAYAEEGQPLVRADLLKKPKRKKKTAVTHNAEAQPRICRELKPNGTNESPAANTSAGAPC